MNSESILNQRRGGATPTRSEDPEGTVLPNRPVTADLHQLKAVEESLEASSRNPEGSYQKASRYPSRETRGEQEEQSEIAKKLGESPEGDSMSNSGSQHEPHLRNLSPSTEKISSRNPKEPVRDLYRPIRDLMRSPDQRLLPSADNLKRNLSESPEGVSTRPSNEIADFRNSKPIFGHESYPQESSTKQHLPTSSTPPWASLPQFSAERQVGTKQDEETATPVRHRSFTINAVTNPAPEKLMN
ncbi:uncharacterized protein Bfra_004442ia [Botrytis fragariae]|uniref:Uncharacterized protein n=1 Tax=Botrytis fragariae TaxID=1964551 RepID=A0A8H6AVZ9_9HELO|nr:uncharacterized protein Bfra_004442ia [Botrytis fragariae]KAF5874435.1 hypothetical protein Bfra_004442ia [Botrytis fragariae]